MVSAAQGAVFCEQEMIYTADRLRKVKSVYSESGIDDATCCGTYNELTTAMTALRRRLHTFQLCVLCSQTLRPFVYTVLLYDRYIDLPCCLLCEVSSGVLHAVCVGLTSAPTYGGERRVINVITQQLSGSDRDKTTHVRRACDNNPCV